MLRSEKIFLFLLISICLIISIVLIDSIVDPAILIKTAYAKITGSPTPEIEPIYMPDVESSDQEESSVVTESFLRDGWNLFRSEGYAFEIQFPQQVVKKSILNQEALNTGVGLSPQAPVWEFHLNDPEYYQGTNLLDASLVLHVLEGVDQEEACSAFLPGSIYQSPANYRESLIETEINGVPYWQDEVLEGLMGEFYHRISYRTFAKGACYQLTQLLHYRNIDSYFEQEIEEFDQGLVLAELDQVMNTFSFLDIEPTFPEQTYPLPKGIADPVSKATSEYVDGLDVSHWQGTIDWPQVVEAGYVFTFAKGTEGVGWTDVKFHENMINGVAAGEMMGIYHFARPDLGNKAADEANHFLDVVGDYLKSGYLRPVLDLEVGSSLGKTVLTNWVIEWMETVKNRTGISPLIYVNPSYMKYYLTDEVTEYDLWVAHWRCEPEPSFYYPYTGMWRDWAFWQYYGPGGCGGNYGYVPGIEAHIDLNIFNGVEEGLQAYDAYSKLWVSLTSDGYFNPAPYSAVLTGNVNGDTTGLMDFAFWWECTALEADQAVVEEVCGVLPVPAEGECEYNEVGMKCIGVENEKQIAEHTYEEIGDYTAKVIVKRGEEDPVEDRYKITAHNPLRYFTWDPGSPSLAVIDSPFSLQIDVVQHTVLEGVLQLSIEEVGTDEVIGSYCIPVSENYEGVETFDFTFNESDPVEKNYRVAARHRIQGECPVDDETEHDQVVTYKIYWMDDKAILELQDENEVFIPSGGEDDLGLTELFQTNQRDYLVKNPSTLQEFQISSVSVNNVVNTVNIQLELESPVVVGTEGEIPLSVSFEVQSSGPYSFDIHLNHDASNPTPFIFTVSGNGGLSNSPIQSISAQPASPGSNLINHNYDLHVDIDLDAPTGGLLQASVESPDGSTIVDSECMVIPSAGQQVYGFDLSWVNPETEVEDYQIWARYRDTGSCPIADKIDIDLSQGYQIDWQEDRPLLEVSRTDSSPITDGGIDDLGFLPLFQTIEQTYLVHNPSRTSSLEVTGISFANLVNLTEEDILTSLPILLGPAEEIPVVISFEVVAPGEIAADMNLEHTADNPSPFSFTFKGEGGLPSIPIKSITPLVPSQSQVLVNDSFSLEITVALDAPVAGALKLSLLDADGNLVLDPVCEVVSSPGTDLVSYYLEWSESEAALESYYLKGEFYAHESCPASGSPVGEMAVSYQVNWVEELPELNLLNSSGTIVPAGSIIDLGQLEYYQTVGLDYLLRNLSSTSSLNITDINIENLENISMVDLIPDSELVIGQEGDERMEISFLVGNTGGFSFDLVVEHQGSNPSPYRITFQGEGIMTDDPIQFVAPNPASPGSSLISTAFGLAVDIGLNAPDQGALQLSLFDAESGTLVDEVCQQLVDKLDQPRTVNLEIDQSTPGARDYDLVTKYRVQGSCPINDSQENDLTQTYTVEWEEEIPNLAVQKQDGTEIIPGNDDVVGDHPFYHTVELNYLVKNTSSTSSLTIDTLAIENSLNVEEAQIDPAGLVIVPPSGEIPISVSFLVAEIDTFSFDININHDGSGDNQYRFTVRGKGVMDENPIRELNVTPLSPKELFIPEELAVKVQVEIDPIAPGIVEISLKRQGSSDPMGETCFPILGEHSLLDVDLNWAETTPGELDYEIEVEYKALGDCPLGGDPDAVMSEIYQVNWKTHQPELVVNRPEGVTIFDGAVDYIGAHDFFRFVEVTYVIDNPNTAGPLIIESIEPENLDNLREVLIEPAGIIEIQPGESQEIVISFQVLTLEPYSFDLIWTHNGSNPAPHITGIMGDSNLNLGDTPLDSWLYRFVESLIKSGFFLKLPVLGVFLLIKRKKSRP